MTIFKKILLLLFFTLLIILRFFRVLILQFFKFPLLFYYFIVAPVINKLRYQLKLRERTFLLVFNIYSKLDPHRKIAFKLLAFVKYLQKYLNRNNQNKVFICIGSLGPGGAERQWANIAINLKIRGFNPEIVTLNNLDTSSSWIVNDLNVYKIRVVSICNYNPSVNLIHHLSFFLLFTCKSNVSFRYLLKWYRENVDFRKALKLLVSNAPSKVLIALDYSNIIFGNAALFAGVEDIRISMRSIAPDNYDLQDFSQDDWRHLYRDLYLSNRIRWISNANHLNESYADYFTTNPRDYVEVIPNVFYFSPQSLERLSTIDSPCKCSRFHILGMMRLSYEKSPESWLEFIKFIELLKPNFFHFILVGNGVLLPKIKNIVRLLKNNNLDIDFVESEDFIFPYFLLRGVIVSSSLVEGHANLGLEASYFKMDLIKLFDQQQSSLNFNINSLPSHLFRLDSMAKVFEEIQNNIELDKTAQITNMTIAPSFNLLTALVKRTIEL